MRLRVVGPKKLMNMACPVLQKSKCQNSVAKPLRKVMVDQPMQAKQIIRTLFTLSESAPVKRINTA